MTKMLIDRAVVEQALEALEIGYDSAQAEAHQFHAAMAGYKPQRHAAMDADVQKIARAITALKAALAEPVHEPVAWALHTGTRQGIKWNRKVEHGTPLYTAPRKPLTEEEIWALYFALPSDDFERSDRIDFARAIERAHGIKE